VRGLRDSLRREKVNWVGPADPTLPGAALDLDVPILPQAFGDGDVVVGLVADAGDAFEAADGGGEENLVGR